MAILYGNSKNSKHTLSKKNKKAGSAGGSHLNVNIPVEDIPAEAVTQEIPAAEPVIQDTPAAVPVSVQEPKPAKEPKAKKIKEPKPAKEPKAAKVKEPKPAKEPKVKKEGGSKKGKIIGITAGAVAALLVAGTMAFGSHVASTDTAYPNVTINGIDVGGMDYDRAYDTLKENGYNSKANTAVINVKAGGRAIDEVRVSSEDAKLTMSLDRAATTAVEYGHGNVFDSAFKYLKCMSGKTELLDGKASFDEESVRAIIAKTAERVDSEYLDNSYTVGEEAVQVTKGAGERHVDQDEVYEMIRNAFETGNFSIMEYESSVKEPEALDFNAIGEEVFVEPQNAKYDTATQGVVKGVPGKTLDVIELKKQYLKAAPGETFEVPITLVAPEIDGSNMEDLLFRDTLASKSTNLTSDSNRNNNITLAAKAINGTVLNPGDVFSFNGVVGQRTTAKGYKTAHAYANGDIVDTVGGGICQVSSTIYYCVLLSDLEVVDRSNHMFPVSYLPIGMDATVSWGTLDFKFKNNTEYPVKIESYVEGTTLYVKLLGTKTNDHTFELSSQTVDTIPYSTTEKTSSSVSDRTVETSGMNGYRADTYRSEYDGKGKLIETVYIGRSTYRPRDAVVLVPTWWYDDGGDDGGNDGGSTHHADPEPEPQPEPEREPDPEPDPEPEPDDGEE